MEIILYAKHSHYYYEHNDRGYLSSASKYISNHIVDPQGSQTLNLPTWCSQHMEEETSNGRRPSGNETRS